MFKCDKCGVVGSGKKQYKSPIKIREVIYSLQVRTDKHYENTDPTYKTIREVKGSEVVKEGIFCSDHIPEVAPEVVESVIKKQTVRAKRKDRED